MKAFYYLLLFIFFSLPNLQSQSFKLLKDIGSGSQEGLALNIDLVEFGDKVYFQSVSETLWETDGTSDGTKETVPRSTASRVETLVSTGSKMFFQGRNNENSLFVSDGTAAGTMKVREFPNLDIEFITPLDENTVVFGVQNFNGDVSEIWSSDGTVSGTQKLTDMEFSYPYIVSRFQNQIIVQDERFTDPESYITDGTPAGTYKMIDWVNTFFDLESVSVAVGGENLIFITGSQEEGGDLWRRNFVSDGTASGTARIGAFGFQKIFELGNNYFIVSNDALYFYNNTDKNLSTIKGLYAFTEPVFDNGRVFFHASDKTPWVSDGTPAGTKQLGSANIGSFNFDPVLFASGDSLFYNQEASDADYWRVVNINDVTDTIMIDYSPRNLLSPIPRMVNYKGKLLLNRRTDDEGHELWIFSSEPPPPPPVLEATLTQTGKILCNGDETGALDLDITGGTPPYDIIWTPNNHSGQMLRNLTPGDYSALVTDAMGLSLTIDATIVEPPVLAFTLITEPDDGTSSGSIQILPSGGTPPYTYWWPFGFTSFGFTDGLPFGDYFIRVLDENDCLVSDSVMIELLTPVDDFLNEHVKVYPTLARNKITIESPFFVSVEIINSNGKIVQEISEHKGKNDFNLPNLSEGLYFVKVKKEEGFVIRKIFISNKE